MRFQNKHTKTKNDMNNKTTNLSGRSQQSVERGPYFFWLPRILARWEFWNNCTCHCPLHPLPGNKKQTETIISRSESKPLYLRGREPHKEVPNTFLLFFPYYWYVGLKMFRAEIFVLCSNPKSIQNFSSVVCRRNLKSKFKGIQNPDFFSVEICERENFWPISGPILFYFAVIILVLFFCKKKQTTTMHFPQNFAEGLSIGIFSVTIWT